MVHRLALYLGGAGAVAVLAMAMSLGGLADSPTAATSDAVNAGNQLAPAAPDTTKTVIDMVYVEAPPEPVVVHVNKPPRNVGATTTDQPRGDDRERDDDEAGEHGEQGEHESD
jgi:hypothetical protein